MDKQNVAYTYAMKYYLVLKRNEVLVYTTNG